MAVTRGTASLIGAGNGPRGGADATGVVGTAEVFATVWTFDGVRAAGGAEGERTTRPASGLSAGAAGGFRAAAFEGGVDGAAGGAGAGAGGRAVTPGTGSLASAGGGTGARGLDVFGKGNIMNGCIRAVGTALPAAADTGFVGLTAGPFAATLPAGRFRAAGTLTAATARPDAGGFAAVFDGEAFGALAVLGGGTLGAGALPALPLV
jgi:hypothetical protein